MATRSIQLMSNINYHFLYKFTDFVEYVWIDVAINDIERANQRIRKIETRSFFEIKYDQIKNFNFETCKDVVNKIDIEDILYKTW